MSAKKRIVLHLDGGGFKCHCQFIIIDSIKLVNDIVGVSGFSMGSLLALLTCFNIDMLMAQRYFEEMYPSSLFEETLCDPMGFFSNITSNKSLCDVSLIKRFIVSLCKKLGIKCQLGKTNLKQLFELTNMDLRIVTSNITEFKPVLHTKENSIDSVLDLVSCSMCYPGVFPPVRLKSDGDYHYDGGVFGSYLNPWSHYESTDYLTKVWVLFGTREMIKKEEFNTTSNEYTVQEVIHYRSKEMMMEKTAEWKKVSHNDLLKHFSYKTNVLFAEHNDLNVAFRLVVIVIPDDFTTFSTPCQLSKTTTEIAKYNSILAASKFVSSCFD